MRRKRSVQRWFKQNYYYILPFISLITFIFAVFKPARDVIPGLFSGLMRIFQNENLHDVYDKPLTFKPKPNTLVLLVPINRPISISSLQQNLLFVYIWTMFIKKYTNLNPIMILSINNDKIDQEIVDRIKDSIFILPEYTETTLYRGDLYLKNNRTKILFERNNRFRAAYAISNEVNIVVFDDKLQKTNLPLSGLSELNNVLNFAFLHQYTPIFDQLLSEVCTELSSVTEEPRVETINKDDLAADIPKIN